MWGSLCKLFYISTCSKAHHFKDPSVFFVGKHILTFSVWLRRRMTLMNSTPSWSTLNGANRYLPKINKLWISYNFDIRLPISKVLTCLIFQVSWPKQTRSVVLPVKPGIFHSPTWAQLSHGSHLDSTWVERLEAARWTMEKNVGRWPRPLGGWGNPYAFTPGPHSLP